MKPILISGIQPSGKLHLGNYFGALKNFVDLQNSEKYDCYFFIADYHSLTEEFDPKEKLLQSIDLAATFLAAGLDPKKSTIFIQSDVPQTTELAWVLSTITPFGELRRMTQFKEKGEGNVGLFTYPVLMAADILLYNAAVVPVGDDQLQHLEFARTLARKFNSKFGDTFTEPKPLLTSTSRVMSLSDPNKKMSKSEPSGCIFLDDHPAAIDAKIKTAVTDSGKEITYDEKTKPGIANMLLLMSALEEKPISELVKIFAGQNYSEFKHALSDSVVDYFNNFREAKKLLLTNPKKILNVLATGKKKAAAIAAGNMKTIREKIGIYRD